MVTKSTLAKIFETQTPWQALKLAILFAVVLALVNIVPISAQSPPTADAPPPSFEVVTIKPNRSGVISSRFEPNRYYVTMKNAMFFVRLAYGPSFARYIMPLPDDQVVGQPGWANTKFYDVDAELDESMAKRLQEHPEEYSIQLRLMLQSFLADRFRLKVSHTIRVLRAYALMASKDGAKFLDQKMMAQDSFPSYSTPPPAKGGPCVPKIGWACFDRFMTIDELTGTLSGLPDLGRPVVNQTGIDGSYHLHLEYQHGHRPATIFSAQNGSPTDNGDASSFGPSIQDALRKQLGLVLQPTKAPVDVLVIDHIEPPSDN